MQAIAYISGASSGIGREIAVHLAQSGWDIGFTYNNDAKGAEETATAIRDAQRNCWYVQCDAGYKDQVSQCFEGIVEHLGVPTLIVNNAGVQTWAPLLELEEEDWDRTIRTNLKGSFLATQIGSQHMVNAGLPGNVINIGSGCNKTPFPALIDYSASKGGLEMFTQAAAVDLGKHGIRVNCVAPGAILIERTRKESPEYEKTWAGQSPLSRVGLPIDIASAVEFLASEKAAFITGQTLYVDGGVFTQPNWPHEQYSN